MNLNVCDVFIGGKLVEVYTDISDIQVMSMHQDDLRECAKKDLAMELAYHMIKNDLILFTRAPFNPQSLSHRFIARCYLTPNDQVKVVRQLK
jgi:hypothetical protein